MRFHYTRRSAGALKHLLSISLQTHWIQAAQQQKQQHQELLRRQDGDFLGGGWSLVATKGSSAGWAFYRRSTDHLSKEDTSIKPRARQRSEPPAVQHAFRWCISSIEVRLRFHPEWINYTVGPCTCAHQIGAAAARRCSRGSEIRTGGCDAVHFSSGANCNRERTTTTTKNKNLVCMVYVFSNFDASVWPAFCIELHARARDVGYAFRVQ